MTGARQESDESCGLVFRSAFPEILKATTELRTAESDEIKVLGAPHYEVFAERFAKIAVQQKREESLDSPL